MVVFNSLKDIDIRENTAVALGNFDGLHKGHQAVISNAIKGAKEKGLKSAVFSFSNSSRIAEKNISGGKYLISDEIKTELLEQMGVDYFFILPFDADIKCLSPVDFVQRILVGSFKMKEAYCGFNYRFGFKGEGTALLLKQLGEDMGFEVYVQEATVIDETPVSSTFIKKIIADGRVDLCMHFWGRHYTLDGEVVEGNRIGRTMGFPTANINIDENQVRPPNGVYITTTYLDGVAYPSVTNLGNKPTIGKYDINAETHIFDFEGDLYGEVIKVEFHEKVRGEVKFKSVDDLIEEIEENCNTALAYHSKKTFA